MRVECDIEGIDPKPVLLDFFNRVLQHAAGCVSLDPKVVGRVIIVSPDRFGRAVASIRPGAKHTETETAVAAGKTIARREGGPGVSDIVLQCSLFGALMEVLDFPPMSSHLGVDQQQALYVICHEFGHAQDYSLRNHDSEVIDPFSGPFSIAETADYFGNIVLTEYAACRNSASVMSEALFIHEMQEATNRMTECCGEVTHYLHNRELKTPRALAHIVCQNAWLIMVELTKLYGHAVGSREWEVKMRDVKMALIQGSPLGNSLARSGSIYPSWDIPVLIAELTSIWHRYIEFHGVRFVKCDDGNESMVDIRQ